MNDTGVRDNYDAADWDCCDEHETAYLKDGYCKDCKIEELQEQVERVRNCQTYVVELDDCEQSWFKKTDVLKAIEGKQ